jgi:hypothetical protein
LTSFSDKENSTCIEEKLEPIKQLGKNEGTIRDNAEQMEKNC